MPRTTKAEFTVNPQPALAKKTLPRPLLKAIDLIFSKNINGVVLVGGTALAGYYAGHRRSDDLDLFVESDIAKKSAILAAESLSELGAKVVVQSNSAYYYRSLCVFENHSFTIDIVLDKNLFRVGKFEQLPSLLCIARLETIFKMKIATLVSRCSEKDLFDLEWLFEHFIDENQSLEFALRAGQEIDAGVNVENILISLTGSNLSEQACDFGIQLNRAEIFKKIQQFKKELITAFREYDRTKVDVPLKHVVKMMKKI